MSKKIFNLTEEGKCDLERELDQLIRSRPEISQKIATARGFGDLSENAEYSAARAEQDRIERRIREIQNVLENFNIIEEIADGKVGLGDGVTLISNKKEYKYKVVGEIEANPSEGKISNKSPLGQQLIDKKVGEMVTIETPRGEKSYKIVEIHE